MSRRNRSNPLGMNRWQRQQEERDRRESVTRDVAMWANVAGMSEASLNMRRAMDGLIGAVERMTAPPRVEVEVVGLDPAGPDRSTVATFELGAVAVGGADAHRFMRLVAGYGDEDAPSVHVSHDGVTWEPLPGVRVEFENEFGNVAPLAVESPVAQQLAEPDLPAQLLNEILVDGACDPEGDDARGWRAIAEGLRRELVRERGTSRIWRNNYHHQSSRVSAFERLTDHDGRLCMLCARELSHHVPQHAPGEPPVCTSHPASTALWTPTLPGAAWCHDCAGQDARYRAIGTFVACARHRPVEAKMADIGGTRGIKLQEEETQWR